MGKNSQAGRVPARCPTSQSNLQMVGPNHTHVQNIQRRPRFPIRVQRNVGQITSTPSPNSTFANNGQTRQMQSSENLMANEGFGNLIRMGENVPIQQTPLTNQTPLLCHVYFNNQGQSIIHVLPQPCNLVAASNSNVNPTLQRFNGNVHQFQASGTPNNINIISNDQVQFLNNPMQHNHLPTINNTASGVNESNASQFLPVHEAPGPYKPNSSSSRLNVTQNTSNEVIHTESLNAPVNTDVIRRKECIDVAPRDNYSDLQNIIEDMPTVSAEASDTLRQPEVVEPTAILDLNSSSKVKTEDIEKKSEDVPKEPLRVELPLNESIPSTSTQAEVNSGARPKRRRKQQLNKRTFLPGTNLISENSNTDSDTNNVESDQIPIFEITSSPQSHVVNNSKMDAISEQNEPPNQPPKKKIKVPVKPGKNGKKGKKRKRLSESSEESYSPQTKRTLRSADNTRTRMSYNENSEDIDETSDNYSVNVNVATVTNIPNNLNPVNVTPASQNTNMPVTTNTNSSSDAFQRTFESFLRKNKDLEYN